jgi:retron-type reverse transcriptase
MDITLHDIFLAYYDCRKNKRSKPGALAFEVDYEGNLFQLWLDICDGTYKPEPSTVFIVTKPVMREIFAASFRDRVVHHLVIGRLSSIFERKFIYDSYSCRVGKGTHFGIQRAYRFMRRCPEGWILKLDIRGYFMSINKNILWKKLSNLIDDEYTFTDIDIIKRLCHDIIFNDPTVDCIWRSPIELGDELPTDKSLFSAKAGCGIPIGNLTSQIFANFYLNDFDHFIQNECQIKFYGRYVDDFILVHKSVDYLKGMIPRIHDYLLEKLGLQLHEKKVYLQPCFRGVKFLGCYIKPSHIVVDHRTTTNFKSKLYQYSMNASDSIKPTQQEVEKYVASVNSYLGIMKHYKTYRKRRDILCNHIYEHWGRHILMNIKTFAKIIKKKKWKRK